MERPKDTPTQTQTYNRYIIDIEINGNQFEKLEAAKAA